MLLRESRRRSGIAAKKVVHPTDIEPRAEALEGRLGRLQLELRRRLIALSPKRRGKHQAGSRGVIRHLELLPQTQRGKNRLLGRGGIALSHLKRCPRGARDRFHGDGPERLGDPVELLRSGAGSLAVADRECHLDLSGK